jgi:hypothetical protein
MMKQLTVILVLFSKFLVVPCLGQEPITKVANPHEVRVEVKGYLSIPKEIEVLQWNRWTSKNFVVCSINDTQAQYLHKHLELVKGWVFARWGLYDVDFSTQCKVIAVDRPELYKKLFNIEDTRVEIRREADGRIKETVIFLLASGQPSRSIPIPLTEVCMAEFAQRYNTKFGTWAYRGMAILNGSLEQIRNSVLEVKPALERNDPLFFSKGILEMNQEQYLKLEPDKKRLYDNCSVIFCLMVRKEFGQDVYLRLLKNASEGSPEDAVKSVLKFTDYGHLDRTLKRYMTDITRDVSSGKTPDSYLQIREKSN